MTAVCAVSSSGCYVPPMLIIKRKRMTDILLRGSLPGTIGACSDNKWITTTLFLKWLEHFANSVKPSKTNKVILTLDGHSSHNALSVINFGRENGIVMISLPPRTTHRLQTLDKTIYGSLKSTYNTECDKWMVSHVSQGISKYDQAALFGFAYMRTATMNKALSGFQSTGLWPYNPDVFTPDDFTAAFITDEPVPQAPTTTNVSQSPVSVAGQEPVVTGAGQ